MASSTPPTIEQVSPAAEQASPAMEQNNFAEEITPLQGQLDQQAVKPEISQEEPVEMPIASPAETPDAPTQS